MAHEIEQMAFFGATPWHGLGTKLDEADLYDWPTACRKAGLDWTVNLVPLTTCGDNPQVVTHKAVRRSSDNNILGVVGPGYTPLQNHDAFKWFAPFLEAREASLHTAGSLKGGTRVWVLARLNRDPLEIVKGDEVQEDVLLSHGHDGSLAVRAGFTPIRVVCQNTLRLAHKDSASKLIRMKHTTNLAANLENVREVMNVAHRDFEATAEQYRRLARKDINQKDLVKYVKLVLGVEEDKDPSTKTKNIIIEIAERAEGGKGNNIPGVRGTLWGAYNGVTEWLSYSRGRNTDTRMNSLWFGDGASVNEKALEVALDMAS